MLAEQLQTFFPVGLRQRIVLALPGPEAKCVYRLLHDSPVLTTASDLQAAFKSLPRCPKQIALLQSQMTVFNPHLFRRPRILRLLHVGQTGFIVPMRLCILLPLCGRISQKAMRLRDTHPIAAVRSHVE